MSAPIPVTLVVSYADPRDEMRSMGLAEGSVDPVTFANAYAVALREMRAGEIAPRGAEALRSLALRDAARVSDHAAIVEDCVKPVDYLVEVMTPELGQAQRAMLEADPASAELAFA